MSVSLLKKKASGFLLSVARLRRTRLDVQALERQLEHLQSDIARLASVTGTTISSVASQSSPMLEGMYKDIFQLSIIRAIADRQSQIGFSPNSHFSDCAPDQKVLTNGLAIDFDGGVNENLKTVLKTAQISQRHVEDANATLISVFRPDTEQFWKCLTRTYEAETPIYYAETAFFGGYASYFDKNVNNAFRKSLGFIIDDMGYYFDSRYPSRLEKILNDPTVQLLPKETQRAKTLISAIIGNKLTKYNHYASSSGHSYLPDGIILVVDQKRNDASIRYGGATNGTFDAMLKSAIEENPGKRICIKPHPDNQFEKGGSCYKPGPSWQIIGDDISVIQAIEKADSVYTVSSQVGFEALLRGKKVVTFGLPFYAGWGLTDDRKPLPRRSMKRTIEELFYHACVNLSVYVDPTTGELTSLENTIDRFLWMRHHAR